MKKICILFFFVCCSCSAWAQHNVISIGSTYTLTIKSNTIFSADSLVLDPSSDFTLSSNAILETPVPVGGLPTNSIDRVYHLNNPITFTGTVQIYYRPSELNGNIESNLKYYDSTIARLWLEVPASTVNTAAHYVQFSASSRSIIAATASDGLSLLPLVWISISGSWEQDQARLKWIVNQNQELSGFTVQRSGDGQSWQDIGSVTAISATGQFGYTYNDPNAQSSTIFYRIKITYLSGSESYSSIIKINKAIPVNDIRVIGRNNTLTIYFIGDQPKGIRVINAIGQTIWKDNTRRSAYELNSVMPGIYFIQYELNGQMYAKQVAVQ